MCWHLFDQNGELYQYFLILKRIKLEMQERDSVFYYRTDEEYIRTFNTPTLVISGEDDGMIPLSYSQRIYEQLAVPVKKFEVIPQAGHMIMIEHVNRSFPAIANWLQQCHSYANLKA